jgi:hypothetical protein
LYHADILDNEYIPTFLKLIPFFFTITGFIMYALLHHFFMYLQVQYTFLYSYIYSFIANKWQFDKIYNTFLVKSLFFSTKIHIYKVIDKGLLEVFGPFGSYKTLRI